VMQQAPASLRRCGGLVRDDRRRRLVIDRDILGRS